MGRRERKLGASRRELLERTVLGLGGAALAACRVDPTGGGKRPGGGGGAGGGGTGGGDTGLPSGGDTGAGDTGGVDSGLADTGPALPDQVPASLGTFTPGELDLELILLSGTLPTDWEGHLWLVHPAPYGEGVPVFMGDGQLVRVDLSAEGARLRRRPVVTPCSLADTALAGTEHAFENSGMARMSMSVGVRNFANTAVVPMGDRVLLTFDAGRPWEVDPDSLETVTAVGGNGEWRSALPEWLGWFMHWPFPLLMSTAHPAVDPESGELFSVAYGLEMLGIGAFTELVRWDGSGGLETWELFGEDGLPLEIEQSVHQLVITRNHIILCDTAFVVEMDLLSTGDVETIAQSPDSVLWIIDRADLSGWNPIVYARKLVLPREMAHFFADFDDSDGIVLHLSLIPGADPSEYLQEGDLRADTGEPVRTELLGLPGAPTDLGALARVVVDRDSGGVVDSVVTFDERLWGGPALAAVPGPDLPDRHRFLWWASVGFAPELRLARLEELYADHPYREVPLAELPGGSMPGTLVRVEADTAEIVDSYDFPTGRVALSPTFVPRPGSDAEDAAGWIVCTVMSDDTDTPGSTGDELWVFDALDLAQGPLARLGHPELDLPFTLHTAWTPGAAPRTSGYSVDVREDHEGEVAWLDAEIQAVFEDVVYPHWGS